MRYSPDEIKSLVLHYGSYEKAAKRLKIGKASLIDAANADIKGKVYRLSDKNYDKIRGAIKRLSKQDKQNVSKWEKILEFNSDHFAAKKMFMNLKQSERIEAFKTWNRYKNKMESGKLWSKIAEKFYDKYKWAKGRFQSHGHAT